MQSIHALITRGANILQQKVESPYSEARILLCHLLSITTEELLLQTNRVVDNTIVDKYNILLQRRIAHEPIAYICEHKEFYGRDFVVNSDTLIPRADTEVLIDAVLRDYNNVPNLNILDLGTGSGCIAITLALELQTSMVLAVDISPATLSTALRNVELHNLLDVVQVRVSDWFDNISIDEKFDIIVANPPYISRIFDLSPEVLCEPSLALFADENGLSCYKSIAANARKVCKSSPITSLYLEIGYQQLSDVKSVFEYHGFHVTDVFKDIEGRDRVIKCGSHSRYL